MKICKEIISSRNNELVKWAASLFLKKYRDQERTFIVEGKKLSFEAIDAGLDIICVFVAESKKDLYFSELEKRAEYKSLSNAALYILSDSAFDKISSEKSPQGIILAIKYLDFFREVDIIYKEDVFLKEKERAIILSSVRDPQNLGSVIRSAAAFGADHIILSSDSADIYNPKTVRAAMGSMFKLSVTYVKNLVQTITELREAGRRVFSAELNPMALSLPDIDVLQSDVFVIGNEGHGVSAEVSSASDSSVYIPISDKAESLNAAVAAGIFMWEQMSASRGMS